ncbi:hypothetical protein THAOC_05947, partial [Thalassiosira oceanica]
MIQPLLSGDAHLGIIYLCWLLCGELSDDTTMGSNGLMCSVPFHVRHQLTERGRRREQSKRVRGPQGRPRKDGPADASPPVDATLASHPTTAVADCRLASSFPSARSSSIGAAICIAVPRCLSEIRLLVRMAGRYVNVPPSPGASAERGG